MSTPNTEREDRILRAIADLKRDVTNVSNGQAALNIRLFGTSDGEGSNEGRLVVVERRVNDHADRISELESDSKEVKGGIKVLRLVAFAFSFVAGTLYHYLPMIWKKP